MISIEVVGISEEQLREFLIRLPDLWYKNSGIFAPTLNVILQNYNETQDLIFGVHVFEYSSIRVLIVLSEFLKDLNIVTFSINATRISGWGSPRAENKVEKKICEIIREMSEEDWADFIPIMDGIFICTICNARYSWRVIRQVHGKFECQNCGGLVNPLLK